MRRSTSERQGRFKCRYCGTEGWYTPSALHVLDPRTDHDRPDGRRCRASERAGSPPSAE